MPVARESVVVIGPDSIMSKAFPAGGPSKMSVNTTSASSISTMRCAVVEPTKPPPTTVTFFRIRLSPYRRESRQIHRTKFRQRKARQIVAGVEQLQPRELSPDCDSMIREFFLGGGEAIP